LRQNNICTVKEIELSSDKVKRMGFEKFRRLISRSFSVEAITKKYT